ncbi:MAG: hypothetical protein ACK4K9_06045 [Bacteroidia bacterium]
MKKLVLTFFFALALLLGSNNTYAQCAMCKSNLESARHNGNNSVGNTINNGIMYLFVLPYAIAGVFGYIYYRKHKLNKAQKQQIS